LAEGVWLSYNFIRPHLGLAGRTPAEAAGIGAKGRNKWHSLIVAARRKSQRRAQASWKAQPKTHTLKT
jgi:hypothetical protein